MVFKKISTLIAVTGIIVFCFISGCVGTGKNEQKVKVGLKLNPMPLGNIFTSGEDIRLSGTAAKEKIAWALINGWGEVADKGAIKVPASGNFVLEIKNPVTGFYSLNIFSIKDGIETVSKNYSLAVLESAPDVDPITSPFGVCTHFGQRWPVDFLKVLKRAGIMNIRDENSWDGVEKEKGVYKFPRRYSEFVKEAGRLKMDTLMIMGFGNKLYASQDADAYWKWAAPYKPEHYKAYADYVVAVLKQYPEELKFIEIWNEYNGGFCPGPAQGRPEIYAAMYKEAYKAVKKVRPDVKVLACSTVGAPIDWIKKAVTAIGPDKVDGVAIHPYRYHIPPEGLAEEILQVRAMLRGINNSKDIPVWVTEQGWYARVKKNKKWNKGISRHQQACYLVRSYLEQLAGGASKIYWYVSRDYPSFPTMGIVQGEKSPQGFYAPHESLPAYATMIKKLNKAEFVKRELIDKNIYHCRFQKKGKNIDVLWSTIPATLKIKTNSKVLLTDMFGKSISLTPVNGAAYLLTEDAPFYLEGKIDKIGKSPQLLCAVPEVSAIGEPVKLSVALKNIVKGDVYVKAGNSEKQSHEQSFNINIPQTGDLGEWWTSVEVKKGKFCFVAGTRKTELVQPVTLSENISLQPDGLHIKLVNASNSRAFSIKEMKVAIDGKTIEPGKFNPEIQPASNKEFVFAVKKPAPFKIIPVDIAVDIKDQPKIAASRKVSVSPLRKQTITVDGKLDDWKNITGIPVGPLAYCKLQDPCQGPEDLGGNVKVCFDDKNIYISAEVIDDIFSQEFVGWDSWKGDNIQLAISPLPPWGTMPAGNFLHELGMTLTKNGPEFYRFNGEGRKGLLTNIPLEIKRIGNRTVYETAIPWNAILGMSKDNPGFSFGFYINDNDGKGRKGFKKWGDIKDPKQLQFLKKE